MKPTSFGRRCKCQTAATFTEPKLRPKTKSAIQSSGNCLGQLQNAWEVLHNSVRKITKHALSAPASLVKLGHRQPQKSPNVFWPRNQTKTNLFKIPLANGAILRFHERKFDFIALSSSLAHRKDGSEVAAGSREAPTTAASLRRRLKLALRRRLDRWWGTANAQLRRVQVRCVHVRYHLSPTFDSQQCVFCISSRSYLSISIDQVAEPLCLLQVGNLRDTGGETVAFNRRYRGTGSKK